VGSELARVKASTTEIESAHRNIVHEFLFTFIFRLLVVIVIIRLSMGFVNPGILE